MTNPHDIINETYMKCLKKAEDKIRELYESELTDEDKELISLEEYAGFYAIDFELEHEDSIIMTGKVPEVKMTLRQKTPEELIETIQKETKIPRDKIEFKIENNQVKLDLDDFKWLVTKLYYTCNAVGCIPNTASIKDANNTIRVMRDSNLIYYVD